MSIWSTTPSYEQLHPEWDKSSMFSYSVAQKQAWQNKRHQEILRESDIKTGGAEISDEAQSFTILVKKILPVKIQLLQKKKQVPIWYDGHTNCIPTMHCCIANNNTLLQHLKIFMAFSSNSPSHPLIHTCWMIKSDCHITHPWHSNSFRGYYVHCNLYKDVKDS